MDQKNKENKERGYRDCSKRDLAGWEEYEKKCNRHEGQTSIALFGLDFIIDKKNNIHCIEVNGQYSGTSGFEEAYGNDFARKEIFRYLASFGLPVTVYAHQLDLEEDGWAAEELGINLKDIDEVIIRCSKEALGALEALKTPGDKYKEPSDISNQEYFKRQSQLTERERMEFRLLYAVSFSAETGILLAKRRSKEEWDLQGISKEGMRTINQAEGLVWNNTGYGFSYDKSKILAINNQMTENITEHKSITSVLLYPNSNNMGLCSLSPLLNWSKSTQRWLQDYLERIPGEQVVLKPEDGSCGRGVVVLPKRKFLHASGKARKELLRIFEKPENYFESEVFLRAFNELKSSQHFVIEQFIESKPYLSPKTGKMHRGCIRYMIMAHSDEGKIFLHHLGGYVRLAPKSLSDTDSLQAQVANLSRGGHGAPLSSTDLQRLERWIDNCFPSFYRRVLRMEGEEGEPQINHYDVVGVDYFKEEMFLQGIL